MEKGKHTIRAKVDEVVFFVRSGKLVPLGKACSNTSQLDYDSLVLYGDGETYELYADDGFTKDISPDNIRVLRK